MNKKVYILIFVIASFFSNCNKYPENTLWFKNCGKVIKKGKITVFSVDGNDSIPLLSAQMQVNISNATFEMVGAGKNETDFYGDEIICVLRFINNKLLKNKVEIIIRRSPNLPILNDYYKPMSYNEYWDIVKLIKKGQLKARLKKNNKLYEFQIN